MPLQNALNWFIKIREMVDALEKAREVEDNAPPGEIRHDMHGYYYCTQEEAGHEDAGNASVGFDLRPHFATFAQATRESPLGISVDAIQESIQESILSAEVRSAWHAPDVLGTHQPSEYRVLLDADCQLTGDLDEHGEPANARLQTRDAGLFWTDVPMRHLLNIDERVHEILNTFAQQFYFGG